jgi:putative FmdB family regulatory protein
MPTYMYKCADCGHRFEAVQGFHDDPHDVCPDCGGQVRRVIGNVGVTFKGSGFYRTDSRDAAKKPAAKAENTPKSAEKAPAKQAEKASAPTTSKESKPASG